MKGEGKKMGGEKSKTQFTYTRWVQTCDAVMCEDIAGYCEEVPFILSRHRGFSRLSAA